MDDFFTPEKAVKPSNKKDDFFTPDLAATAAVKQPTGKAEGPSAFDASSAPAAEEPGWFMPGSKSEAAVRGFSQMATLGHGDEIQAALRTPFNTEKDKSILDTYRQLRDDQRNANAEAQSQNPGSYLAGEATAVAPLLLASGGSAAPALSVRGAAQGAAIGATAGMGNSNADLTKGDIGGTAADTAIGGVVGAALPAVGSLIGKGTSKIGGMVGDYLKKQASKYTPVSQASIEESLAKIKPEMETTAAQKAAKGAANMTNRAIQQKASDLGRAYGQDTGAVIGAGFGGTAGYLAGKFVGGVVGGSPTGSKLIQAGATKLGPMAGSFVDKVVNSPIVQQPLQKGVPFAAIHMLLQQQSPEYRMATKELDEQQQDTPSDSESSGQTKR